MLLPDNINPEISIYYNGGLILAELQKQSPQNILNLYSHIETLYGISFPIFVLCLDWLYLLEAAELRDNSEVYLCS